MAILPILTAPHPRLTKMSRPVERFDRALAELAENMLETMYAANGIGLAAPQVDVHQRVVVMDLHQEDEPPAPQILVNPEVLQAGAETATMSEGCLSVPEAYEEVERPARVTVRYQDLAGVTHTRECTGLEAVCWQHEIDHLDGVLFVDRLNRLKRDRIIQRLVKEKRLARRARDRAVRPAA